MKKHIRILTIREKAIEQLQLVLKCLKNTQNQKEVINHYECIDDLRDIAQMLDENYRDNVIS